MPVTNGKKTSSTSAALAMLTMVAMLSSLCGLAAAHGVMIYPPVRGTLGKKTMFMPYVVDPRAPVDFNAHYPMGDKSRRPGSGKLSQMQAAGPGGWTPYNPMSPYFTWRAGPCGDLISNRQPHLKGGEFYFGGRIVATFTQDSTIDVQVALSAHHNGFMEFYICDVSKCRGGDISAECFTSGNGACTQMWRAPNAECDGGNSKRCGPIDRANPGRWYLPCSSHQGRSGVENFGQDGTIKYMLPSGWVCRHCVLQMYWVSANSCNPPGVVRYFTGRDRPRAWGRCRGQGDAIGGYARNKKTCGWGNSRHKNPDLFSEEYLQCADIRIRRNGGGSPKDTPEHSDPDPSPSPSPESSSTDPGQESGDGDEDGSGDGSGPCKGGSYDARARRGAGSGGVRDIVLLGDGCRVASLVPGSVVNIGQYASISVEAIVSRGAGSVVFSVDGNVVQVDRSFPYHIAGSSSDRTPLPWDPPLNKVVRITATADGDSDSVDVTFVR